MPSGTMKMKFFGLAAANAVEAQAAAATKKGEERMLAADESVGLRIRQGSVDVSSRENESAASSRPFMFIEAIRQRNARGTYLTSWRFNALPCIHICIPRSLV